MSTKLLFRWGVWLCYTEWRPDQPHEDWSGSLAVEGGEIRHPQLVMYHGCWGAQRRTYIELPEARWQSPLLNFTRPIFGYKGLEGLAVEVDGDENTLMHFRSGMLDADIRLGDIPREDWWVMPAGSKYSCSQLVVCRFEDEGIYWNARRTAEEGARTGRKRIEVTGGAFLGDWLPREVHHRIAAWVPSGGTVQIPFTWEGPAIATLRFTGQYWAALSDSGMGEMFGGCTSPRVTFDLRIDGRELAGGSYKAKYMRGAYSSMEHTAEFELPAGEHRLEITNTSPDKTYLALYSMTVQQPPAQWETVRQCLPFQAPWFDGTLPVGDMSGDLPSGGRGLVLGYDTNMMAAENGWIDAVIRFMAATGGGNYLLFRTESDVVSEEDWRRWFTACRDNGIYFAINTSIGNPALPIPELLQMAQENGGALFLGRKHHELSIPLYAGLVKPGPARTLAEAEEAYLQHIREAYGAGNETLKAFQRHSQGLMFSAGDDAPVPRLLGEAALAHRYAYRAGVDLILSETMTGHTCLLLSEARGAAKAYGKSLWGMHIACHVHCSPEDFRTERMFRLNLYLGYLAGASIIEDEEGGLAKVHSFVSGPTDPLPLARQQTIAEFYRWTRQHRRTAPLQVEIGLLYGRHEVITGGMSLHTQRPVRVWDGFGPNHPAWEYGEPEYGWLLADLFQPGAWLCPVLQDASRLRRWFAGSPYGQVDITPIEADDDVLAGYKLLIMPGWHTMRDEDMEKLIRWVETGGTLVLALPQLQTSDDRTAVLSGTERQFPDPALVSRLCGIRIQDSGATVMLDGGNPAICEEGQLLLVEHTLGSGTVYTFTTPHYFGHLDLLNVVRPWLEILLQRFPLDVRLEGGDGEVSYYVYPEGGQRHVYLINTDWTLSGNEKRCRVIAGGKAIEVMVREGEVTEITI